MDNGAFLGAPGLAFVFLLIIVLSATVPLLLVAIVFVINHVAGEAVRATIEAIRPRRSADAPGGGVGAVSPSAEKEVEPAGRRRHSPNGT